MKKIFHFLKTILLGIFPATIGVCIASDVYYVIHNIQAIATSSGWSVVLYFVFTVIEIFLAFALLYDLGEMFFGSIKWNAYKKTLGVNTIDSSSKENETSNEATDTSSEAKSKSKCKKSQ